jgi:hypothetical protein
MEVNGQLHAPTALPPGKEPLVPSSDKFDVISVSYKGKGKAYWGSACRAPLILSTSALDGGEWSASRPGRFTPREEPLVHSV